MKRYFLAALPLASLLYGQRIQLDLDHLVKKASKAENVSVDPSMMEVGKTFIQESGNTNKMAAKIIKGVQSVYVRSFKFDKPGAFTNTDIERVRRQLRRPGWSQMTSATNTKSGRIEEVYFHSTAGKTDGLVVLDVKPTELEVVNVIGTIDANALAGAGAGEVKQ